MDDPQYLRQRTSIYPMNSPILGIVEILSIPMAGGTLRENRYPMDVF